MTYPFPDNRTPFDLFSVVANLNPLLKLLEDQSNLYTQQNGTEFKTNTDEIKAFQGINYFMAINKLPTMKSYWECGQYVGNEGLKMSCIKDLNKYYEQIYQKDEKVGKAYKVRSVISHFYDCFSA